MCDMSFLPSRPWGSDFLLSEERLSDTTRPSHPEQWSLLLVTWSPPRPWTEQSISPVLRWGGPARFTSLSPRLTHAENGGKRGSDTCLRPHSLGKARAGGCGPDAADRRVLALCIPWLVSGGRLGELDSSGPSTGRYSARVGGGPLLPPGHCSPEN